MDYAPVVERLRAMCPGYKLVDFAANFEALRAKGFPALPMAVVLHGPERGSPNQVASGAVHNKVRFRFRVYHLVKFAGDVLGGEAMDILEPLREPVRDALMAWKLPSPNADTQVEFDEADFVQFLNGVLVFYDQFAFNGFYRRVP